MLKMDINHRLGCLNNANVYHRDNNMNILDINNKYLLASSTSATHLLELPDLTLFRTSDSSYKLGHLQYATGIAVLCKGSLAIFYDFKYNKAISSVDTYLKIVKIALIKNLLIAVSDSRILIYDTIQKVNLCYIPVYDGYKVGINPDYYNLKLFYPINAELFEEKHLWTNKATKIKCTER